MPSRASPRVERKARNTRLCSSPVDCSSLSVSGCMGPPTRETSGGRLRTLSTQPGWVASMTITSSGVPAAASASWAALAPFCTLPPSSRKGPPSGRSRATVFCATGLGAGVGVVGAGVASGGGGGGGGAVEGPKRLPQPVRAARAKQSRRLAIKRGTGRDIIGMACMDEPGLAAVPPWPGGVKKPDPSGTGQAFRYARTTAKASARTVAGYFTSV